MSLSAWDRLLLRENLFWAWQKAAALYRTTEVLHDQSEVASFDLDLEANLESIRRDFARGAYKLQSIKLLPQPKGPDGNKHRMRQSFQISVRDQVAWIAVVNAIGPGLDIQMPPWSYGHRLHRSAWLPDEWEKDQSTRIGPYRHSSSQLFRKFRQSWPLYRRHIVLTARHLGLGHIRVEDLDEGERRALETELSEFNTGRLPYLINGYFENVQIGGGTVYYASLDLEKFYPSISTSVIFEQFLKHSSDVSSDQRILNLIQRMLNFRVSAYGLSSEMQRCEPPASEGKYDRVPTGLMVAGFLSNVAMLDVDNQVTKELPYKGVAHFRFVDDHTFLSPDFEMLLDWISRYRDILRNRLPGVVVNESKYEPPELRLYLSSEKQDQSDREKLLESARHAAKVDPAYPRPLLTRTLAQLSLLGGGDFDILDDESQRSQIEQIVTLMLTALPDTELREDTRKAYAAARLSALVPKQREDADQWVRVTRRLNDMRGKKALLSERVRGLSAVVRDTSESRLLRAELSNLEALESKLKDEAEEARKGIIKRRNIANARIFDLLLTAFSEHPHKGRLLEALIRFCRHTGFHGLGRVFAKLSDLQREYYPLGTYLRATAFHTLGYLVAHAGQASLNPEINERARQAATLFLTNVASLNTEIFKADPEKFSHEARTFLAIGAATAAFALGSSSEGQSLSERLVGLADEGNGARDVRQSFVVVAGTKLSSWLHWAEAVATTRDSVEPSPLWQAVAPSLDPAIRLDWNALRRYPKYLPSNALRLLEASSQRIDKLDEGWVFDVLQGSDQKIELPGNMSRVKRALAQPHGRVDLVTWAAHTRKIYSNDPFDPRSSEWTALEVLRQVLRAIEAFRRHRTDLCHPTNYTVPVSWLDLPQDPWNRSSQIWTWESWRSFSCGEQCIEPRGRQSLISDYRYKQGADAKADDALRSELIAYGLLLFGLLRKSFEWPALWNVRGQERSHVWLASTESHRLPISSETLSILDALLKPRSWETYLLFSLAPGFTGVSNAGDVLKRMVSDTDLDVTPLTTPKQIQDAIRKAQRTLERGQIAGFANRPRQLVPVSIRHLTNAAIAGEQTNEED